MKNMLLEHSGMQQQEIKQEQTVDEKLMNFILNNQIQAKNGVYNIFVISNIYVEYKLGYQ